MVRARPCFSSVTSGNGTPASDSAAVAQAHESLRSSFESQEKDLNGDVHVDIAYAIKRNTIKMYPRGNGKSPEETEGLEKHGRCMRSYIPRRIHEVSTVLKHYCDLLMIFTYVRRLEVRFTPCITDTIASVSTVISVILEPRLYLPIH